MGVRPDLLVWMRTVWLRPVGWVYRSANLGNVMKCWLKEAVVSLSRLTKPDMAIEILTFRL